MILGLPLAELILCGIIVFGAAVVRGYSGFGFTAVIMAGLTFFLPVAQIVPMSIAMEVLASAGQVPGVLRFVNWRRFWILLIAGLLGVPVGIFLLSKVPDFYLRITILALIFVSSATLIFRPIRRLKQTLLNYSFAGVVAGVANGSTAMSGFALALFFTMTDEKAAVIRATLITYLFATDIWTAGVMFGSGFFDEMILGRILASLPLLGLGIWVGSRRFDASNQDTFRRNILWLLLTLSAIGLISVALKSTT